MRFSIRGPTARTLASDGPYRIVKETVYGPSLIAHNLSLTEATAVLQALETVEASEGTEDTSPLLGDCGLCGNELSGELTRYEGHACHIRCVSIEEGAEKSL